MRIERRFDLRDQLVHRADQLAHLARLLLARDPAREIGGRLDLRRRARSPGGSGVSASAATTYARAFAMIRNATPPPIRITRIRSSAASVGCSERATRSRPPAVGQVLVQHAYALAVRRVMRLERCHLRHAPQPARHRQRRREVARTNGRLPRCGAVRRRRPASRFRRALTDPGRRRPTGPCRSRRGCGRRAASACHRPSCRAGSMSAR